MVRGSGLLLSLVALAACVPDATPPATVSAPPPRQQLQASQRPAPIQSPRPAVATAPARPSIHWLDAQLSVGSWVYRPAGAGGSAAFFGSRGSPSFALRCEPGRRVSVSRTDGAAGTSLTLRTSSTSRSLGAVAAGAGQPGIVATVSADDPLLDALAFSRGRFAVETAGAPTLIVPAWPELARVVEDCRR